MLEPDITRRSVDHDDAELIMPAVEEPVRILMMGKMGSGKTMASNHLISTYHGTSWTTAERIKQISHALIDQNGDLGGLLSLVIHDPDLLDEATIALLRYADSYEAELGTKPRGLYQDIGQILRELHPSTRLCWEWDLEARINANPSPLVVIDARAQESFNFFVSDRGYSSLLIDAPEHIRLQRLRVRDGALGNQANRGDHVSETDCDTLDFQYRIVNSGSDEQAYLTRVAGVVQDILRSRAADSDTSQPA